MTQPENIIQYNRTTKILSMIFCFPLIGTLFSQKMGIIFDLASLNA